MGEDIRGIEIAPGFLLAPHRFISDEDEQINYAPVTPENAMLKIRAIREFCKKLEGMRKMVNSQWASGHIMCILKYGEGFTQDEFTELNPWPRPSRWWRPFRRQ